jgi:hypothetical protein
MPSRLKKLGGFPFPAEASQGSEGRGLQHARRSKRALDWMSELLGFQPDFRLSVAGQLDWPQVAQVPIYGVPQTFGDHVILPAEEAALHHEVLDALQPYLTEATRAGLLDAYGDPPRLISFLDFLAVHELTHLFHDQADCDYSSMWVAEFHAHLGAAGYFFEFEPDRLPGFSAFAACALEMPGTDLAVHTLDDMEQSFESGYVNHAWYQLRLGHAALGMWEKGGAELFRNLFDVLRSRPQGEPISLEELGKIHPELAAFAGRGRDGGGRDGPVVGN